MSNDQHKKKQTEGDPAPSDNGRSTEGSNSFDPAAQPVDSPPQSPAANLGDEPAEEKPISQRFYEAQLRQLQVELVKMQEWVRLQHKQVVVVFEGRDAAGKGGTIKRIAERLNPRVCRIVALGTPTEREKKQWYFQRYVNHLPTGGEIVLMDRSWYNRAGVERVMEFCTDEQYFEFLVSCPDFERLLIQSGITLIKYWFSISADEQEKRFQKRRNDPTRHWKLSDMDLESRRRWNDYSRAKDIMMQHTDTPHAPWWVVEADNKKRARLNCIHHLLSMVPYRDLIPSPPELGERPSEIPVVRSPKTEQNFVPEVF